MIARFILLLALLLCIQLAVAIPEIDPDSDQGKKIIAAAEEAQKEGKNVVFRGVSYANKATLDAGTGFTPNRKGTGDSATPAEHVGDYKNPTEYSSTSTDIRTALKYANPSRGVVIVDVDKAGAAGRDRLDLSNAADREKHFGKNEGFTTADADLKKYPSEISDATMKTEAEKKQNQVARAHANAERDNEVLLKGDVPQDACTVVVRRGMHVLYRRSACTRRVGAMNKQLDQVKVMRPDGTVDVKATMEAAKKTRQSLAKTNAERVAGGKKALNFKDKTAAKKWTMNADGEYVTGAAKGKSSKSKESKRAGSKGIGAKKAARGKATGPKRAGAKKAVRGRKMGAKKATGPKKAGAKKAVRGKKMGAKKASGPKKAGAKKAVRGKKIGAKKAAGPKKAGAKKAVRGKKIGAKKAAGPKKAGAKKAVRGKKMGAKKAAGPKKAGAKKTARAKKAGPKKASAVRAKKSGAKKAVVRKAAAKKAAGPKRATKSAPKPAAKMGKGKRK
ncbi:hypothetical protein HDU67_001642 [Dinochytrium kinnereticum]|nr:hypothetical protein HDU67_001642 [Dinochytrium kinnereticum]